MAIKDLQSATPTDLFKLYSGVLNELRRRKIIRSTNNPVADYAELLMAKALRLQLVTKSTKGYDAIDAEGARYEVKGRRVTPHNASRQLSFIRGLKERHFTYLAGVLFAENFSVIRACLIPVEVVEKVVKFVPQVNGWRLLLQDELWDREDVRDITAEVKAAAESL